MPLKYLLIFTLCCCYGKGKNLPLPSTPDLKGSLIRIFKKKKSRVDLDTFKTPIPSELKEIIKEVKTKQRRELNRRINESLEDIITNIEIPKRPTMKEELLKTNFDRPIHNEDIELKEILEEYHSEELN